MPKVKLFTRETGPDDPREVQVGYVFFCPGCKYRHEVHVYEPRSNGAQWGFNGDLNNPTFTPSIHITTGLYAGATLVDESDTIKYPEGKEWNDFLKESSSVCHSFVTDGYIEFLGDCTHELKGQKVEIPEIDW